MLASLQILPCPLSNITAIECRIASTQEPVDSSNPDVKCDLESLGFQCRQTYKGQRCEDYEMRVYCQCHEEGENNFTHFMSISDIVSVRSTQY